MKFNMRPPTRQLILLLGLAMLGCSRVDDIPKGNKPVMAFVAASTKEAVQEVAGAFKTQRQTDVMINADDSSKLAMQITQEAPAHLFLSANEKWTEFVKDKGYAQEARLLLGNALVIVTPKGNPAGIHNSGDLTKGSLKRLAVAGPTVPAGIYARRALRNLNIWETLEADKKVVDGENVRVALTYVERGEAEAGIVYATDAKISDKVELVYIFPADTHDPIRYPLVLLKSGNACSSARAFFDYLQSPRAKKIFAKHGFTLPERN
jgi:molybdate transport system substrate-binding protein